MDPLETLGLLLLAGAGGALGWARSRLGQAHRALTEARDRVRRLEDGLRDAVDDRDATVRRVREQAEGELRFAHEPLARDLVEVVDSFERALQSMEGAEHADGVALIHRQLVAALSRHGVQRLEALGRPFDPEEHEAVATEVRLDAREHTVVSEWAGGWRVHGRLLRASRVVLAVPPPPAAAGEE